MKYFLFIIKPLFTILQTIEGRKLAISINSSSLYLDSPYLDKTKYLVIHFISLTSYYIILKIQKQWTVT